MRDVNNCTLHVGDVLLIATRKSSSAYLFEATITDLYEQPRQIYAGFTHEGGVYRTEFIPMVALRLTSNGRIMRERQDSYRRRVVLTKSAYQHY